jgi:hypothetical protein
MPEHFDRPLKKVNSGNRLRCALRNAYSKSNRRTSQRGRIGLFGAAARSRPRCRFRLPDAGMRPASREFRRLLSSRGAEENFGSI